ncbi:MAG: diaminopimelate epimerase [Candidatus Lindowbacteria bacterium]|nr:diaminopimelate epimerase [Candidatus Lindowbacteria bacterium]
MKFHKLQGAGNDYVYVDTSSADYASYDDAAWAALAVKVSRRAFSVGSDGLILIESSETLDAKMRIFNADGSEAEMCGNGIRCVAKFLSDNGRIQGDAKIETKGGPIGVSVREKSDNSPTMVRVDMGPARLDPQQVPTTLTGKEVDTPGGRLTAVVSQNIDIEGDSYAVTCVSMGNPHCVIFHDDVESIALETIGPKIENHSVFPERANIEFVQILDDGVLLQRTWERGSGETLACGTGASAVMVAAILNGHAKESGTVRLRGGELKIEWSPDGIVYMTGPAVYVYQGELDLEELDFTTT